MKAFIVPDVEIVRFEAMDIIASSDNELPLNPLSEDTLRITRIE